MRRTSFSSVARIGELPALGQRQQAIVGDAAPQEKRQARGEFQIAEAIGAGRAPRRIAMDAQQKVRIHQHPFERELNPAVEASAILPAVIEELEQRLHVRFRHRPAIRQPGHPAKESSWRRLALPRQPGGWQTKIARRLGVSLAGPGASDKGRRSAPSPRSRSPCTPGRSRSPGPAAAVAAGLPAPTVPARTTRPPRADPPPPGREPPVRRLP